LVKTNNGIELVHVPNTGRMKELLFEGTEVILLKSKNINRKTRYTMFFVKKGRHLICINSVLANNVFEDAVKTGLINWVTGDIKREVIYHNSRIDFYVEGEEKTFIEIKCGTYEEDGVVMFPDAPTERGIKHLTELSQSIEDGYEAYLFFIIQMKGVLYFTSNYKTHPAFGKSLSKAAKQGVKVIALDCEVAPDAITARDYVSCNIST
jgi:sugar fermentation stimulation protein A